MLEIRDLHAKVDGKEILKGLSLTVGEGEVHAIMGPNGSGKSTLSNVLTGRDGYEVTSGEVLYKGKNLFEMEPEERARAGLFLAFQYPVEIPGVGNLYFLMAAVNAIRKARGEEELDAMDFLAVAKEKMKALHFDEKMLNRHVNDGFSGGEKKKNEIFQMILMKPDFSILDEVDSGLDIDALKVVADGVNTLRDGKRSFLIITHYQRLLNYIEPDKVHVLSGGKVVRTGDKSLAVELEKQGYDWARQAGGAV